MTLEQAFDKLKPFEPEVPDEALDVIRNNWLAAEPLLLAELDRRINQPLEKERTALFHYALYLCAEMRCEAAFERYIRILRLPNVQIDILLGDILTQDMLVMLSRTCAGRIDTLKKLIEDETVYEYSRSESLLALQNMVIRGEIAREEIAHYCLELMSQRLERRHSYVWDVAVSIAGELRVQEALPLIQMAYQQELANPEAQSYEEVIGDLNSSAEEIAESRRRDTEDFNTGREMVWFVKNWKNFAEDEDLLSEPRAVWTQRATEKTRATFGKIGRNDPCPCGSGKKYKKCCIDKLIPSFVTSVSNETDLLNLADEWIAAGYYYLDQEWSHKARLCWYRGWQEVRVVLPDSIQDPAEKKCNDFFNGFDFFSNWLQEYQELIEQLMQGDPDVDRDNLQFCRQVLERFPAMDTVLVNNFTETTALLLLALGQKDEAFALLEQMIKQHPHSAQGYAVLATVLSLDAADFNLKPDVNRARQLLQQAQEQATDCDDWSIDLRLKDLNEWER